MKTQHTPGPWTEMKFTKGTQIYSSDNNVICHLQPVAPSEDKANARLIAAAPEMLEVCEQILDKWHSDIKNFHRKEPIYLESIRKIIKKAKGE